MQKTECSIDLVQGQCRDRFSSADYHFMLTVLGHKHDVDSLNTLFHDPDAFDIILDEPMLANIAGDSADTFSISSRFYLYIMVRSVFRERGLDNRELADYVAEMLANYFHSLEMHRTTVRLNPMGYIFDLTKSMQKSGSGEIFRLRLHIANFVLFQLGIYPERFSRPNMASMLDFEFLEGMAVKHLRKAMEDPRAMRYGLLPALEQFSNAFRDVRLALYDMAEQNLFVREQRLAFGR